MHRKDIHVITLNTYPGENISYQQIKTHPAVSQKAGIYYSSSQNTERKGSLVKKFVTMATHLTGQSDNSKITGDLKVYMLSVACMALFLIYLLSMEGEESGKTSGYLT